jgi:hypothetical protein
VCFCWQVFGKSTPISGVLKRTQAGFGRSVESGAISNIHAAFHVVQPKRTTGLEPAALGLESRSDEDDARRLTATNGSSHADLRAVGRPQAAWLRREYFRRFGHELATA